MYQKGILVHWGDDVVSLNYCFGKGGYVILKLSCYYMNIESLQNVMVKIINDSNTLYL